MVKATGREVEGHLSGEVVFKFFTTACNDDSSFTDLLNVTSADDSNKSLYYSLSLLFSLRSTTETQVSENVGW